MYKYLVTKSWKIVYANPISLCVGDIVMIDHSKTENNPDWQGWVWCQSNNNAGWIPKQIFKVLEQSKTISKVEINENYSAKELAARAGDIVFGNKIVNGWIWCSNENDKDFGWLPLQNLTKLS